MRVVAPASALCQRSRHRAIPLHLSQPRSKMASPSVSRDTDIRKYTYYFGSSHRIFSPRPLPIPAEKLSRSIPSDKMHQPMFPANGSLLRNGVSNGTPKAFSDDTKILGYDPVIMPALIYAELPLVHLFLPRGFAD